MDQLTSELIELAYMFNDHEVTSEEGDYHAASALEEQADEIIDLLSKKFDNAVEVIKNMDAKIARLRETAKLATDKARTVANQKEKLKAYLLYVGKQNEQALKGELYKGSIISRISVGDYDPDIIPDNFLKIKSEIVLDKKGILNSIKQGTEVPGVEILEKHHLAIR